MSPSDTTNTAAAAPTPAPAESFLQEVEAKFEVLEQDAKELITEAVTYYDDDIAPYVKAFFVMLWSQTSAAAIKAVVANIPALATGNVALAAAAVGATIMTTVAADAGTDANTVLAQVQAAQGQSSPGSTS